MKHSDELSHVLVLRLRLRKDLADTLTFTTIEKATALARSQR